MRIYLLFLISGLLAGCASSSTNISGAYVSPIIYQSYTCPQLAEEAARVSAAAATAAGVQDSNRTSDAVMTTVAVVVFWPALFALRGDGVNAAELARLKGTMEAVENESIRKKCRIEFKKANPT